MQCYFPVSPHGGIYIDSAIDVLFKHIQVVAFSCFIKFNGRYFG